MNLAQLIRLVRGGWGAFVPLLGPIVLSGYAFRVDAPEGELVATISGKTPGSALALAPDDHRFELVGNDLDGWAIVRGSADVHTPTETVNLVETLVGYPNSPRSTEVIFNVADTPTEGNLYLGALTPNGYGAAFGETYAGSGYLQVEGASGNGMLKLRYNGANNLVFGTRASTGAAWPAVTTTPVTPTGLEDVYTFDAVEYSDAACTMPTGNRWPRTLYTRAVYQRPAVTILVGGAQVARTLQAMDIDLSKSRFAVGWLKYNDPRYVAVIAARPGDMLPDSGTNNQIVCIQKALTATGAASCLGQSLVLCPGDHNMPFVNPTYPDGTYDYPLQIPIGLGAVASNTLAAFGSDGLTTAGNWYTITQIDPARTRMGYLKWAGSANTYTRFTGMYIMRTRATITNSGPRLGLYDQSSGSATACLWFDTVARYSLIDNNIFDMDTSPAFVGEQSVPRLANAIYAPGNIGVGGNLKMQIRNNIFGRCFYVINLQNKNDALGELPIIHDNENTGEHQADVCHLSNWFNFDVADNNWCDRRFPGGIHPDFFQIKTTPGCPAGDFPFGSFQRNLCRAGVDDPEAVGQVFFFNQQNPDCWYVGGNITHNIGFTHKQNGIVPIYCDGLLIEHNVIAIDPTVAHPWNVDKFVNADVPYINLNSSKNCIVRYNVIPNNTTGQVNSDDGKQSGVANTGPNKATNQIYGNVAGVRQAEFGYNGSGVYVQCVSAGPILPIDAYASPAYGSQPSDWDAACTMFRAKTGGPLDVATKPGVWDKDGNLAS